MARLSTRLPYLPSRKLVVFMAKSGNVLWLPVFIPFRYSILRKYINQMEQPSIFTKRNLLLSYETFFVVYLSFCLFVATHCFIMVILFTADAC